MKRSIFRGLWPAAALVLLSACSTYKNGPTEEEIAAYREAQNVFPANYKADLLALLRNYLNDPTAVRSAALSVPERKKFGGGERYVACFRYDARQDGRYRGAKTALLVFVSGKLDRMIEGAESVEGQQSRELCKDAAFTPFPEAERLTR